MSSNNIGKGHCAAVLLFRARAVFCKKVFVTVQTSAKVVGIMRQITRKRNVDKFWNKKYTINWNEVWHLLETAYSEGIVYEIEDSKFCENKRGRYYT